MNTKNYFLSGVTELLILAILSKKDAYVYEIVKIINNESKDTFSLSLNTIYASTYKLENERKISEYSKRVGKKRTRVYYHIEEAGLEYFYDLLNNYRIITSKVNNILDLLIDDEINLGGHSNNE